VSAGLTVELAGVQTEDGRILVVPKDNAEATFDAARAHDAMVFWLEGPTTHPQPVLLRRSLYRRRLS
jgi:hypothetical protein